MNYGIDLSVWENEFEYKGHQCAVRFKPGGFRCGYVALNEDDFGFRKTPADYRGKLCCHGGVTYCLPVLIDHEYDPKKWRIGFDFDHIGDGLDIDAVKKYYGKDLEKTAVFYSHSKCVSRYGSKEEVIRECRSIVDQVIARKEDKK